MTTQTAETDFGALHIQRIDHHENPALRYFPWRTTYTVTGNSIEGHLSIDPAFGDTTIRSSAAPYLPPELALPVTPDRFSVRFGRHGDTIQWNGTPAQHDGILLVDHTEVLITAGPFTRDGGTDEFPVMRRTAPYASAPVPLLTAAKTHQAVYAVLKIHGADTEHTTRMSHLYGQYRVPGRRKRALQELHLTEELAATLRERAAQLRQFLDQLDASPTRH
ncbi:hypothetical protein [Streptomyces acidiscabies]|uniref:FHA domain-containing protein n=1 Tax=Streptomyces acidiscabies TaxID=42234 RepID=A0ABU4LYV0_9ACTN|nr:hypothetical protein [Streptomyces acidiscabies]MDX3020092.1 hypothetical protein [Streptomyces acidiscabies]